MSKDLKTGVAAAECRILRAGEVDAVKGCGVYPQAGWQGPNCALKERIVLAAGRVGISRVSV